MRNRKLYVLRLARAAAAPFAANSWTSQVAPRAAMSTFSNGLYSSHSPGRERDRSDTGPGRTGAGFTSTSRSRAVRARDSRGAVTQAIQTVTNTRTAVRTHDCQRKMVSVNGMTPVTERMAGGMLPGFACSWAAEDDRPNAQTEPNPMQAPAAAAR